MKRAWLFLVWFGIATSSCGPNRPPAGSPSPKSADDARFASVLSVLPSLAGGEYFAVMSHPLDSSDVVLSADTASFAKGADKIERARQRILAAHGIPLVPIAGFPGCPNTMAFGLTPAQIAAAHLACPRNPEVRFAIALPRAGGIYNPSTGLDTRQSGIAKGYYVFRVFSSNAGQQGRTDVSWDIVIGGKDREYAVIDKRAVYVVE